MGRLSKMLKNAKDNSDVLEKMKEISPDSMLPKGMLN